MSEQAREYTGKTVEEAISAGLSALRMAEDEVDIEIVNKGSRGILGFGSEPALVRMSPKPSEPAAAPVVEDTAETVVEAVAEPVEEEPAAEKSAEESGDVESDVIEEPVAGDEAAAGKETEEVLEGVGDEEISDEEISDEGISDDDLTEMASDLLARMIDLMGFDADVVASWQEADETTGSPYLLLDIRGDNLGALIGRRGETLASLQYLLRLMVNQQVKQWKNIVVDVEQYKQRRVNQLSQLADRMARQVAETGRSVTLEPMPGNERRIVHMTLRDHSDVFTESTGDGERRKVNIFPRHD